MDLLTNKDMAAPVQFEDQINVEETVSYVLGTMNRSPNFPDDEHNEFLIRLIIECYSTNPNLDRLPVLEIMN
jgi:hypothetical protein